MWISYHIEWISSGLCSARVWVTIKSLTHSAIEELPDAVGLLWAGPAKTRPWWRKILQNSVVWELNSQMLTLQKTWHRLLWRCTWLDCSEELDRSDNPRNPRIQSKSLLYLVFAWTHLILPFRIIICLNRDYYPVQVLLHTINTTLLPAWHGTFAIDFFFLSLLVFPTFKARYRVQQMDWDLLAITFQEFFKNISMENLIPLAR